MNEIVNKFYSLDINLTQNLVIVLVKHLLNTMRRFKRKKIKKSGYINFLYQNDFDKACFAQDAVYADSKVLTKSAFQIKF